MELRFCIVAIYLGSNFQSIMASTTFQKRVDDWLKACFPADIQNDKAERTHRFLEEALELAQANDCPREHAIALVNYVYGRKQGKPELEVGGVMVTLAGLCCAYEIDMADAGELELNRNWSRIDAIRAKQQSKPKGSPLPE